MTEIELKEIFESDFSWDNWRKVMDFVFPEFEFSSVKVPIEKFTKDAEKNIKGFYQHGSLSLEDGVTLSLFETELVDSVNIPKNVKGIRKFIAEEAIANTQASIAVFYSEDKSKWRFTLAIKKLDEESKEKDHKPESFTYVFGKGEKGRTAADRFVKLAGIKEKKLTNLEEAFSVEALSKKFFVQYTSVYKEFVNNITENKSRLILFKGNNPEKSARDFVKKMMGRMVFLYFLQKKGWMGCKTKWKDGKEQFMLELFKSAPKDELFYQDYLQELFFEVLNKKREETEENCEIKGKDYGKVPFLNGGLFEQEENHPDNLTLDWKTFQRFFDILDAYNFTIIEDDPDFKEVAVDPEMLGHIFENLLEDNKDKGAFYTPKEIVQYMCQESLIEYLNTKLSEKIKSNALKDNIREFVLNQHFVQLNDLSHHSDRFVLQALKDIKVCDPAIGSGAFPMGILQEIFRMVEELSDRDVFNSIWELDEWDSARVKEEIIQNSIYGIDIEKGAVDIARLRFWLSIIIDEKEPKPLPNLDYKIMQGNSLLERFGPIDLKFDQAKYSKPVQKQENLFGEVQDSQISIAEAMAAKGFDIVTLENEYFNTDSLKRKEEIRKKITSFEKDFINEQINDRKEKVTKTIFTLSEKLRDPRNYNTLRAKKNDENELKKAENELVQISDIELESKKIKEGNKPYFLWNIYYADVTNQGGFDLVIGNPPYVQLQRESGKLAKQLEILGYETFERTGDIYSLFYELGFLKLAPAGVHTFITSSQWMKANYGKSLRKYFAKHNPVSLILLGPGVFETATVDTNIIISKKESFQGKTQVITVQDLSQFHKLSKLPHILLESISEEKWIVQNPIKKSIDEKIRKVGRALSKWDLKINFGVKTGYNKAFIINKQERDNLISNDPKNDEIIKPVLRGRDISKYYTQWEKSFIVATFPAKDIEINKYPELKSYLSSFLPKLKQTGATFINDNGEEEKCRKATVNKWFETQDPITFFRDFSKPKIIWKRIGSILRFTYEPNELFTLDSTCIATGEKLKYLTGLLNSKLCKYQLTENAPKTGMGDLIISVQALDPLLVYYPNEDQENAISELVEKIIENKKSGKDTIDLEREIDLMVFKFYNLSFEEVATIDPAFWLSKGEYEKLSVK